MKRALAGRLALALFVVAVLAAFFLFRIDDWITLDMLKAQRGELAARLDQRPLAVMGVYFILYATIAALSIPGAAVMTIAGGAVFGLVRGVILVSFASVLGATLAFLGSRYLFRDLVRRKFGRQLE